jgi:hypothetical protein
LGSLLEALRTLQAVRTLPKEEQREVERLVIRIERIVYRTYRSMRAPSKAVDGGIRPDRLGSLLRRHRHSARAFGVTWVVLRQAVDLSTATSGNVSGEP